MLTRVRLFAQAHGLHVWFVAHPAKMVRNAEGKVPAPKGYDISGSAAWFAKADHGITVHRPDPTRSVASEIHSWKSRFSWLGKQGQCTLYFNTTTSAYSELNDNSNAVPDGVLDPFADIGTGQITTGENDDEEDVPF